MSPELLKQFSAFNSYPQLSSYQHSAIIDYITAVTPLVQNTPSNNFLVLIEAISRRPGIMLLIAVQAWTI
jgi:hypothetical protein